MAGAPNFDADGLLAQVDGDRELLDALLEAFRQEWQRRAAETSAALLRRDRDAARRALHALAGMLGQLGARAAPAVVAVERLVKTGDLEHAARAWATTTTELELLDAAVRAVLEAT